MRQSAGARVSMSLILVAGALGFASAKPGHAADLGAKTGTLFVPYVEWELSNPTVDGNPFDVEAFANFRLMGGEQTVRTPMFFAGGGKWKFRFSAPRTGTWVLSTTSTDSDLNGHTGTVTITKNADPNVCGFHVSTTGEKWLRQRGNEGGEEAFVPQLVMYLTPRHFWNKPALVDGHIKSFIDEHGFTGFHVFSVASQWTNLTFEPRGEHGRTPPDASADPDPRTFEALEMLVAKANARCAQVHIWMWGQGRAIPSQLPGGVNGATNRRIMRYIAARLGPLPGWSMQYGVDLQEWTSAAEVELWAKTIQGLSSGFHPMGARSTNVRNEFWTGLDYHSDENHKPTYASYVQRLQAFKKPAFAEDRFRIRSGTRFDGKDYSPEMTRRGLWHSVLAGGVANSWGYLLDDWIHANTGDRPSGPFPNKTELKTHAIFFNDKGRFVRDMVRDATITDGHALRTSDNKSFVFYKEATDSVVIDLSKATGNMPAVAVDTKQAYKEIDLGPLAASKHTWRAPHNSDWAVAVGSFTAVARPVPSEPGNTGGAGGMPGSGGAAGTPGEMTAQGGEGGAEESAAGGGRGGATNGPGGRMGADDGGGGQVERDGDDSPPTGSGCAISGVGNSVSWWGLAIGVALAIRRKRRSR